MEVKKEVLESVRDEGKVHGFGVCAWEMLPSLPLESLKTATGRERRKDSTSGVLRAGISLIQCKYEKQTGLLKMARG